MAMVTDEMFNELFTRMRETEAQTREQQVKIDAITEKLTATNERIENFTSITDTFIKEIREMEERSEKRENNFWKIVYVLIGTIVSMAVGPKIAKDIMGMPVDAKKSPLTQYISPIAPMPDHGYIWRMMEEKGKIFIV